MRMARINITMPDELSRAAKQAGLNVSRLAQRAVSEELARIAKVAELDRYLAELDASLGPLANSEMDDARAWADRVLGSESSQRTA